MKSNNFFLPKLVTSKPIPVRLPEWKERAEPTETQGMSPSYQVSGAGYGAPNEALVGWKQEEKEMSCLAGILN